MNAIARVVLVGSAAAALAVGGVDAEQQSAQQLLERGAFAEATQRVQSEREAGNNDPASTYIAGEAFHRMDQHQQAREEFARLANGEDETWKAIGQSAIALLDNAQEEAVAQGTRARDISGEHGFAHYQLGMALERRGDWNGAAEAFDRASQLMPNYAYAFYHAGVAHQRAKRFNQMAERFTTFLQLAPDAPERRIVQLALNALRG